MRLFVRLSSLPMLLVMAGLLASPACAQAPAPPADAMVAARELVAASKATDQFKNVLPLIMQQLKPAVVQGRPAVEKDYDAITPMVLDAAFARLKDVAELLATIYANNFSAAELREVTAFYRTPTGQKLLEKLPMVMQQSAVAGQQFARDITADLEQRVVDELRKRGHDIKL